MRSSLSPIDNKRGGIHTEINRFEKGVTSSLFLYIREVLEETLCQPGGPFWTCSRISFGELRYRGRYLSHQVIPCCSYCFLLASISTSDFPLPIMTVSKGPLLVRCFLMYAMIFGRSLGTSFTVS